MKRNIPYRVRKIHRYLGLTLGIQFLLWTAGGLYFSWSDMDQIHGDHQKALAPLLQESKPLVSPQVVLDTLRRQYPQLGVVSLELIDILGNPTYRVVYQEKAVVPNPQRIQLAIARTGQFRAALHQNEALALGKAVFWERLR